MPRRDRSKHKRIDPRKDPKPRDRDEDDAKKTKRRDYKPGMRKTMMGNPAVVETYEDARENAMINRDVPTMKNGGEAKVRGMGAAIKGGKFEGVF